MNPFSRNQSCYLAGRTKYRLRLPGDPRQDELRFQALSGFACAPTPGLALVWPPCYFPMPRRHHWGGILLLGEEGR